MRFPPFAILLLLLLGACAGQERPDYDRDPWADYDPYDRQPTYDEDYVLDADRLVWRAKKAIERGREDQARVDYHQAFRRDRWHPGANDGYQDLMLREGLFDKLWQEYIDLWQQHPERGDAYWYHLRPMLIQRGDQPAQPERRPNVSESDQSRIDEYVVDAKNLAADGDTPAARETIERAIAIADWPELHILRIEFIEDSATDELLAEYTQRLEENPASGDAVALYALALARTDPAAAMKALRDAWILEYPGLWVEYALGIVFEAASTEEPDAETEVANTRETRGWELLALRFLQRFTESGGDQYRNVDDEVASLTARVETREGSLTTAHR